MSAMAQALKTLAEGRDLPFDQARAAMDELMSGEATHAQIGAFLAALRVKGETPEELTAFATVMREKVVPVRPQSTRLVDTCGTGGDVCDTFNISTAAAFVAAAAGAKVAKHGNRAATSKCGSADVLQALGINLDLPPERVAQAIDEVGIGFMFAVHLHPAMKHAVQPRRELGFRTVFNCLGPLTNPAGTKRQVMGVFSREMAEPIAHVLARLGAERAFVVYGECGMDEISTTSPTWVCEVAGGEVRSYRIAPEEFGLPRASLDDLRGGTPEENAKMLCAVLEGERGPRRDIVALNAAAALACAGLAPTIADALPLAFQAIDSGAAAEKLERFREFCNQ